MKPCDTIFENCMMWLSDISVYRCRLKKIHQQLTNLKSRYALEGKFETYISVSQKFQNTQNKLQVIESRLLHTINKRLNELYMPKLDNWTTLENEDELFENMIAVNKIIIELQKSIHEGFKTKEISKKSANLEHPTLVIDISETRKMTMNKRG